MRHPYIYKVTKKDTGQFYIGSQCRGLEIGKNYFKNTMKWKKEYAKKNNINFLVIKYNENINIILDNFFKKKEKTW